VVRIKWASRFELGIVVTKTDRARTSAAVAHARDHKQAVERGNVGSIRRSRIGVASEEPGHLLIEVDGALGAMAASPHPWYWISLPP
jgi:hypothetical protein